MKNLSKTTYWLSVGVLGVALGLSLQFVQAWTDPESTPPDNNVAAPLNTSANNQTKTGALVTGGLGTSHFYKTQSASDTWTIGSVLTLANTTTGEASWQAPSGGGGSLGADWYNHWQNQTGSDNETGMNANYYDCPAGYVLVGVVWYEGLNPIPSFDDGDNIGIHCKRLN
jgi:hypothetical protein